MITTPIVRAIVRVQYQLLRAPLSVLDERMARHLSDGSAVRVGLRRSVDALDAAAGNLLGTADAGDDASAPAAQPVSHPPVEVDQVERVTEQLLTDPDLAPVTGELADADEEDQRYIAALRAKNIVAEHEAVHGKG